MSFGQYAHSGTYLLNLVQLMGAEDNGYLSFRHANYKLENFIDAFGIYASGGFIKEGKLWFLDPYICLLYTSPSPRD